jgi:hypothetical protein
MGIGQRLALAQRSRQRGRRRPRPAAHGCSARASAAIPATRRGTAAPGRGARPAWARGHRVRRPRPRRPRPPVRADRTAPEPADRYPKASPPHLLPGGSRTAAAAAGARPPARPGGIRGSASAGLHAAGALVDIETGCDHRSGGAFSFLQPAPRPGGLAVASHSSRKYDVRHATIGSKRRFGFIHTSCG